MIPVSIAIPTFDRGTILVETIRLLLDLDPAAAEILVIDQTLAPPPAVESALTRWNESGAIRWIRLPSPSIPHAMNVGLMAAASPLVLFLDDDIVPDGRLVGAHAAAHGNGVWAVVGQVLQPGEEPQHHHETTLHRGVLRDLEFRFNHDDEADVQNVMAGNLSVVRSEALAAGGFDENFIGAAYRFETDFARRLLASGGRIRYVPSASIRHLKAPCGGVRAHGDHRATTSPAHSAGDYYFALLHVRAFWLYAWRRLASNLATRHHLTHAWLLPAKVIGELRGIVLARRLLRGGRRLASPEGSALPTEEINHPSPTFQRQPPP